jgi:phosphatidylglycerol:prolipoprotein diacylglycerol transferase
VRSVLFYIPSEFAGQPVFGMGWLLAVWLVVSLGILAWLVWRHGFTAEIASYLPVLLVGAGVVYFLLPGMVEVDRSSGEPLGIPVRGFGVMLMAATVLSVGLAAYRAQQMGINPDHVYTLAFCMFIAGIVGARLFFVIQYWPEFVAKAPDASIDWPTTIKKLFNVTQGGLVVYGSVLAGLPVGIWYLRKHHLPILAMGDIIAPSMVLGQALGRIGCFLNGCCFGGVCLTAPYAMTFPASSPPYADHQAAGWHSGVWLESEEGTVTVAYVDPTGGAATAGVKPGQIVERIGGANVESLEQARELLLAVRSGSFEIETAEGAIHRWNSPPPPRSVPIHPTQLYAAIDAGLLALLLWSYFPFRRRDGEVFALLITLHPISRFVLELIRSDEPGQLGTQLTISQLLSLVILAGAGVLWWYVERQPRGSVLPLVASR